MCRTESANIGQVMGNKRSFFQDGTVSLSVALSFILDATFLIHEDFSVNTTDNIMPPVSGCVHLILLGDGR
jgi:hypothetical protein